MRLIAMLVLVSLALAQDSRNTQVLHTDSHFTMPVYKTRAEWEARAARLRKQILFAAGLLPAPPKSDLAPQIFGRVERPGYSVEKVLLQTLPGYYVGGNLYRPLAPGRKPAVLSAHGHWAYGRLENTPLNSVPARAIGLAKQGFVVLTHDMTGYNDTVQTPHEFTTPREQLWNFSPLGLQLWNSIRAIDFLESLPDVDPARIAMTGESGGGTQTFLATAVDERIRWAVPVNMISAIMQGGAVCENAPGLRIGTSNLEFAALAAPRPMLMISATGDWTRNTPAEEFPAIRAIYQLYDRAADIENVHIDAPHNYNQPSREAMYRFFAKRILGTEAQVSERGLQVEKPQDLLALHNRALPPNALTHEQIFEQWIATSRRQSESASPAELRERLTLALGAEWPAKVHVTRDGAKITLSREGKNDRVPGIWTEAGREALLYVHPEGAKPVPEPVAAAASALSIDVFQTGAAIAPRDRGVKHFLTFNPSDDAARAQDILTALRFLDQSGYKTIRLRAEGKASLWALFAAAVSEVPVELEIDDSAVAGSDDQLLSDFFVPGIQRAGGVPAARALTNR